MYNPFPFDDPRPVNRPELSEKTVKSIISGGNQNVVKKFVATLADRAAKEGVVVALDGYTTAYWTVFVNLIARECCLLGLGFEAIDANAATLKSGKEIDAIIDPLLIWDTKIDPTLLYGKVYKGGYQGLMDEARTEAFKKAVPASRQAGKISVVYGYGSLIPELRELYDVKVFFDLTPMKSMLRIRRGEYSNLGKERPGIINRTIRRCYYCDFECAVRNRHELWENNVPDWYVLDNDPQNLQLMPFGTFSDICAQLVKYPFRAKPCYLEGVWGGSYMKKLRNLPDEMRNAAWVFDFIPMEVSVVVEAGDEKLDINYCSFVHKEGVNLMGEDCVKKFEGYFPIRFNWDDSYHSTGNMSIQCHSGGEYNVKNYNEFGRQDESYYVVVTGHDAKTFIGFRDDADIPQFFRDIEAADTEHRPCDYMKYVSYEESKPGLQVMLPAGTIHSSGRNQVILEIGSLTIGSYTYKMYDYLRLDFDGKQRPIHTRLGEENVRQDRRYSVIHDPESPEYIVQKPRLAASGEGWEEYILGENPQVYFSLRRLEFEKKCEQDTGGKLFHVLTLVDGDAVRVRSVRHPERYFDLQFMDIVCVPADMGRYVIENLGREPVMVHKTCLREGYQNDPR
ncbi:MAG: phosphoheptose isomerase [Candidatus Cryptobacteroides sp.]|nr:phosphoheptose isomerase [Candidatus Cryptobacteroides sp.]